jgi:hypothetical protein
LYSSRSLRVALRWWSCSTAALWNLEGSDDFDLEAVVFLHQLKFAIVVCQICHELVEFQAAAAERRGWVGARIGSDRDEGPGDSVVTYTG